MITTIIYKNLFSYLSWLDRHIDWIPDRPFLMSSYSVCFKQLEIGGEGGRFEE